MTSEPMDYKVKYIAHYWVTARHYRRPEKKEERAFDHKWEADKFVEDWDSKHWFSHGWVEERVVDNRCAMDRALSARAAEAVARTLKW